MSDASDAGIRRSTEGASTTFPGFSIIRDSTGPGPIIICGSSRGGTSWAASIFARLAVPFDNQNKRVVSRKYEHAEMRSAFLKKDRDQLKRLADEMSKTHRTWAWKLPAIQHDFDFVRGCVADARFALVFKDPLSVAYRKSVIRSSDILDRLVGVVNENANMCKFAKASSAPTILMSYGMEQGHLFSVIGAAARFAGVSSYDVSKVARGVADDWQRYYSEAVASQ